MLYNYYGYTYIHSYGWLAIDHAAASHREERLQLNTALYTVLSVHNTSLFWVQGLRIFEYSYTRTHACVHVYVGICSMAGWGG